MVGIVHSENVDYVSSDNIEKLRVKYPIHSIIAKSPFARKSEKKQARANAGMNEVELSVSVDTEESEKHDQHALVITGTEISHFTEAMWDWVLVHDEIVFARTTPEDKLTIVTELQNRGHTVGVTGDGVNDAPALKKAECGVAMGAGSEVSKEAADLVLTDNDFSSILVGIKYGRLVFDNLIKVMLFLFPSGSWCEIIPVILNVFFGLPIPLSAFLMVCSEHYLVG
jgi:magnesium-transporting ATPase (P-type)